MNIDGLEIITKLHSFLTSVAAKRQVVTYSDAMLGIGWNYQNSYERNVFAYLLKAVSYLELGVGHPPLTAIVVAKSTGYPNEAFFSFAASEARIRKNETNQEYWNREVDRVYSQWATQAA